MELSELRTQMDSIDDQLVKLFGQRMEVAAQIADYKKANDLPIFAPAREREILQDVAEKAHALNCMKHCHFYILLNDFRRYK